MLQNTESTRGGDKYREGQDSGRAWQGKLPYLDEMRTDTLPEDIGTMPEIGA